MPRVFLIAVTFASLAFPAGAAENNKPAKAGNGTTATPAAENHKTSTTAGAADGMATGKSENKTAKTSPKTRVYTFSGLDVEGKLKTPQLLYFLNRIKLELDTSTPPKRSFMRELEDSSRADGL